MRTDLRKAFGGSGEGLAYGYLSVLGYEVLARNWRMGRCEVDLVCRDGSMFVFVEVKLRRSSLFGDAREVLRREQRLRLLAAAAVWMKAHPGAAYRFDVVAITLTRGKPAITLMRNAFS